MTVKSAKPRRRHDWAAIERDYRTGQFTLKELEAKHGAGFADISRRAKRDGWTKDLRQVVRQATSAAVIAETTKAFAREAQRARDETVVAVLAVAELNKQVILLHRSELREARDAASDMLRELRQAGLLQRHSDFLAQILAGEGVEAADIAQARQTVQRALSLGSRVSSLKALADAITRLQAAERIAFGLDEKAEVDDAASNPVSRAVAEFMAGIHGTRSGRLTFAEPRRT